MLTIKKSRLILKVRRAEIKNKGLSRQLMNNILEGDGLVAISYLVKKGMIDFTKEKLQAELELIWDEGDLALGTYESLTALLANASNGKERVITFMKGRRRIEVV